MNQSISILSFVSPEDVARLDRLEFLSRKLVNGHISGNHKSIIKGGCSEFSEHRPYSPGDEIRHIDWRVFARNNRYVIKQYDEETVSCGMLVLDVSGSMNFSIETQSKLAYAKSACACSARLILAQRDPIGLVFGNGKPTDYLPPRASAQHLHSILHKLYHAQANGAPSFVKTLTTLILQLKQRTHLLLFTDGLFDLSEFESIMRQFSQRGHQVTLFHTLAPEELNFTFQDGTRFECLEEKGLHRNIDPAAFVETYLDRMQAFLTHIKRVCIKTNCSYVPMVTDVPVSSALSDYLRTSSSRGSRAAAETL